MVQDTLFSLNFLIICYAVIDPMHNLFLDMAKHLMIIWKDCDTMNGVSSRGP